MRALMLLLAFAVGLFAVSLADTGVRAQEQTATLSGDLPRNGGSALAVFSGGSAPSLAAAATAKGCDLASVWVTSASGELTGYVHGAPAAVNARFTAAHGAGLPPQTPLVIVCRAPATPATQPTAGGRGPAGGRQPVYAESCEPRAQDNYRTNETFAIDPRDPSTLYVGVEYRGMFKSTDRGQTWSNISSGLKGYPLRANPSVICILEMGHVVVDPTNSQRLLLIRVDSPGTLKNFIAENSGLFESTDGGASWRQIMNDWMNSGGGHALAVDPRNPQVIYYGAANFIPRYAGTDGRPVNTKGVLYKTADGGATWEELATGLLPDLSPSRVAVDPLNPARVLLATAVIPKGGARPGEYEEYGIMLSEDDGVSWISWADRMPLGYRAVVSMAVSPGFRHIVVVGQSPAFAQRSYVSVDGGRTFVTPSHGVTVAAFDPHDLTGLHAVGVAGTEVVESRDGGLSWARVGEIPAEIDRTQLTQVQRLTHLVFDPVDPRTVYLTGAPAAVWRSSDGGATWAAVLTLQQVNQLPLPRAR